MQGCAARPSRSPLSLTLLAASMLVGSASVGAGRAEAQISARDQALVLFQRAEEHYEGGRYDTAATLLREAIGLHEAAPLYYNLARTLDAGGDPAGAAVAYRRFLELEPEYGERAALEVRVGELLARADADAARAEATVVAEAPAAEARAPSAEVRDAAPAGGGEIDPAPWVVLAMGVLPLGAGIATGLLFDASVAEARDAPTHREAVGPAADAELFGLVASVSFAVAGAVALVGLVWGIVQLATRGAPSVHRGALRPPTARWAL